MTALWRHRVVWLVGYICLLNVQNSAAEDDEGSYEEYEIQSRSLEYKKPRPNYEPKTDRPDSIERNPYKQYKRERERMYEQEDEGWRTRRRNDRGYENRRNKGRYRDRDKGYQRQNKDSRDYRKPVRPNFDSRDRRRSPEYSRDRKSHEYSRDKKSREYSRGGKSREYSRDRKSREYSRHKSREENSRERDESSDERIPIISDSRPLEDMMEETFERYKHQVQERLNQEWEEDRKQMLAQRVKDRNDNNFVEREMFGNNREYLAPNQPAKKVFGRKRPMHRNNERLERKYGKQFGYNKPMDINHNSMKELVFDLYSQGLIKSSKIYDTMLRIDRKHYLMKMNESFYPYKDQIQYLPLGVIINAPHEHARSLELLKDHLRPGSKVLDIGSGSGYLTACFAHMVGATGQVTAVELIPEILQFTQYNIQQGNPELLPIVKFEVSDGRASFGAHGPYDVIHVGGAYSKYPEIFLFHLKPGGRLVIPIGETRQQMLNIYDKFENGTVQERSWGLVQVQYLKSISQQLRLMDLPKPTPMSVALKYYIERMLDDREADLSDPKPTTEGYVRKRGDRRKRKQKKFYNLNFDQRKHKMDEKNDC